ncbi:MAG: NAD(P)/FAD-dependent oxidoreductase [Deltaproteobacteria bacterium]|nr:NAD(P)/FAD-dependent oxidoreductase [Deltaproteobacteria bacterium]
MSATATPPKPVDPIALERALAEANLETLLMVHTHWTRDEAFLERFAPHIKPLYGPVPSDVPESLAAELRERLLKLFAGGIPAEPPPLPRALMQKMMSIGAGEPVEDEFIPLLLDQMAFEKPLPRRDRPGRVPPPADFHVVVIGAGLSGICAGVKLGEAGYGYTIFEKNENAGGTWWENVYPGVGVDTPSHFYSFSFAQNPDWNQYHPRGADMRAYFLGVVERFGLRDRIEFETRVLGCEWDEAKQRWRVEVKRRDEPSRVVEADAVLNAHGIVNRPSLPKIPGLDAFQGVVMHTTRWNPDVPLEGKRIAQLGTGASGAQLAVAIAPKAAKLTIFQRSRHWLLNNPSAGQPVSDGVKWALRNIPKYAEWYRFRAYWFAADGLFPNVLRDPAWPHQDRSVSAHNDAMRELTLAYYREKLADRPDLLEKVVPEIPIFSKRIVMDTGYLDTLKRPNVELETDPIERVTANAIVTRSGREIPVDVIALATGFEVAKMLGPLRVIGRGGRDLGAEWGDEEARAHLGIQVPGYPNFFMTGGPNSAPNHAAGQNIVSERQVHYMIECLDYARSRGKRTIEPTEAAYEAFNRQIDERMPRMIWSHPKATSYYRNSKGRIYLSWPYRLVDYFHVTERPNPDDVQLG